MITTVLLIIISYFLGFLALLLPAWTVWPADIIAGIKYVFNTLATLNFIFPIDTFLHCLNFLADYAALFFSAKLIINIINWFRGAGEIKI